MAMLVTEHHIENRAAAQRKEHNKLHQGEAAAGLLGRVLRIGLLVLPGISQLGRGAVSHFHRAALELAAGARAPVGCLGRKTQSFFDSFPRQALAGLHIRGVAFIDQASTS
jgi:hypothetical protein